MKTFFLSLLIALIAPVLVSAQQPVPSITFCTLMADRENLLGKRVQILQSSFERDSAHDAMALERRFYMRDHAHS